MKKIKILVVDDHPLVRFGVINQLKSSEEYVVVGEAEDGEDAIAKTKALGPDLVIMDIFMPGISGIEATKLLRKKYPSTRVLILTGFENEDYVYQIIRSGAGGYILKSVEKEELLEAVQAVMSGERFFSPRISKLIVENFIRKAEGQKSLIPAEDDILTKREKEILALVADGLTNQQIAEKLFISARTVDTHRTNIMQKLNIHDVANLVRYAMEKGLVQSKE
ncbi:MAG TPA: response regulator transcription factor [Bacteroidota bacterium]|nr:response regulator transcription factor [Bacteroidota bacterium]